VKVTDAEAYGRYAKLATEIIPAHGGVWLARGGAYVQLEGPTAPGRSSPASRASRPPRPATARPIPGGAGARARRGRAGARAGRGAGRLTRPAAPLSMAELLSRFSAPGPDRGDPPPPARSRPELVERRPTAAGLTATTPPRQARADADPGRAPPRHLGACRDARPRPRACAATSSCPAQPGALRGARSGSGRGRGRDHRPLRALLAHGGGLGGGRLQRRPRAMAAGAPGCCSRVASAGRSGDVVRPPPRRLTAHGLRRSGTRALRRGFPCMAYDASPPVDLKAKALEIHRASAAIRLPHRLLPRPRPAERTRLRAPVAPTTTGLRDAALPGARKP
jgi:hypothetical protein